MKAIILLLVVVCVGCGATPEPTKSDLAEPNLAQDNSSPVATTGWVSDSNDPNNITVEGAIRRSIKKPTDELTKADLEKVTELDLGIARLTPVKGLENLDQLTRLNLDTNKLTDVKALAKLIKLNGHIGKLFLDGNPAITKAQIDQLQKALPSYEIFRNYNSWTGWD